MKPAASIRPQATLSRVDLAAAKRSDVVEEKIAPATPENGPCRGRFGGAMVGDHHRDPWALFAAKLGGRDLVGALRLCGALLAFNFFMQFGVDCARTPIA